MREEMKDRNKKKKVDEFSRWRWGAWATRGTLLSSPAGTESLGRPFIIVLSRLHGMVQTWLHPVADNILKPQLLKLLSLLLNVAGRN